MGSRKNKEAVELLKEVKSRKLGAYFLGKCYQELGDYNQAVECFERAKKQTQKNLISLWILLRQKEC